ncbi:NAD(P)-binding domain-containing protein [Dankookia sp. P2]|uniref:NAD(P)-binding domain-containing protein n=1 Tax=Dankookia sp. P2 TaxID=3423955 RepID=UPI003D67CD16
MVTIGFVGLGAMGLPMARNLVARAHRVRGFDMRPAAGQALAAAEAAQGAKVLVLMVVNAGGDDRAGPAATRPDHGD